MGVERWLESLIALLTEWKGGKGETRLSFSCPMFSRSFSRAYSTHSNKGIIDLLQKCTSNSRPHLSLLIVNQGLKEENSSPTRNQYKVRSFQNAIASIYEHNKPISSGKEASKVLPRVVSSSDLLYCPRSYGVLALVLPTE